MENLKNAAIAFLVPLPSIAFYLSFLHHHHHDAITSTGFPTTSPSIWEWCAQHPLLLANVLFFANVDLLFWFVGSLQSKHWLIDLYWTVIPVMLVHYFASHPVAKADGGRSTVVVVLTWVWSIRLTHSYFRREGWQWGEREDWRFNQMRKEYGKHWWWMSFFAVYVSQQIFLIGICLPLHTVHSNDKALDAWDIVATVACTFGIVTAYFADTQLHNFVRKNNTLKVLGVPPVPVLDRGLWHYSRHPNYFGEQLWWWGLYIFGWNTGHGWTFVGPLMNSLCLAYVTILVERRILKQEYRTEAYQEYQKTTSVWIPWFKSTTRGVKDKAK